MTARSPSAFFLSLALHALFVIVCLFSAYALKDETVEKTKIFELVAGEGDNFAATEAPALGVPGGIKFNLPPMPAPTPPAPEPVVPAPPEPAPIQAVAPPKAEPKPAPEPKPPDLVKSMKRVQTRLEKKQKAEAARRAKEKELASKRLSYQEFLAQQKKKGGASKSSSKSGPIKTAKIDAEGIAKGVVGGSTSNKTGGAGGTALSREEQDDLDSYIAMINLRLREAHQRPAGLSENLVAQAEFFVSANGAISKVRILKSSGSTEFDQSVLAAIRDIRTAIPPRNWSGVLKFTFRMKDPE